MNIISPLPLYVSIFQRLLLILYVPHDRALAELAGIPRELEMLEMAEKMKKSASFRKAVQEQPKQVRMYSIQIFFYKERK